MNRIGMQNNIIQTPKISSATLVVDFVVTSSKIDRKFEEKHFESIKKKAELDAMKKKAELEAKKGRQKNKSRSVEVKTKHVSKKEDIKPNTETGKIKTENKNKGGHKVDFKV